MAADDLRAVATELLRECPCCGGEAMVRIPPSNMARSGYRFIECKRCGLATPIMPLGRARKRWNRRAVLARPVDEPQQDRMCSCGHRSSQHYESSKGVTRCHGCRAEETNPFHNIPSIVPSASSPTTPYCDFCDEEAVLNVCSEHAVAEDSSPTNERVEHMRGEHPNDAAFDRCLLCCNARLNGVRERLFTKEREIEGRLRVWELQRQKIERLEGLLRRAQENVCSYLCPSTKKTGEEWTHVSLCCGITEELSHSTHKGEV